MNFNIDDAIRRNEEYNEKANINKELFEFYTKTIDNLSTIIKHLPDGQRKEYLENYQLTLMALWRQNYLARFNIEMNRRNSNRIDYLMQMLYEKKQTKEPLHNNPKINEAIELMEKYKHLFRWVGRKYEDEAKELEGKDQ